VGHDGPRGGLGVGNCEHHCGVMPTRFVRRRLVAVLLLVVAASVLTALAPLVLKWLVDGFAGQSANLYFR
jgi:hypothetical protein